MSVIVVFARPPLPSLGKTRLAAAIGAVAASRVAEILLEHTLVAAAGAGRRTVLALAGSPEGWRAPDGFEVEGQGPGGLGERMAAAFARRFAEGQRRVVLVGADCPAMSPSRFDRAFSALDRTAVVLGPATDGGYWLVGQRAPGVDLFSGVVYSSPETLAATRARLAERKLGWSELEVLADVDTRADLDAAIDDPSVPADLRQRLAEAAASGPD